MSVRKLTAKILTVLALLSGLTSAHAQTDVYVPIANDMLAFDPDFRWFEPIYKTDLLDRKPSQRATTGWYTTYDRLVMQASRPEVDNPNASDRKLDGGWGHRYEVGFFLPNEEKGWFFNYTRLGVGGFFTTPVERLNRVNLDELTGEPDPAQPPFGTPVPAADGNTPGLNTRTYFIQESENVFQFQSYELNHTWRLDHLHYGGVFEPLIGFRWHQIRDLNASQFYQSTADVDLVPPGIDPPLTEFGDDVEQLISDSTITDNDILNGQLGFRYHCWRNRFHYSGDFRCFMGGAYQCSKSMRLIEITIYDGDGIGDGVERILTRQTTPIYSTNSEFSIGFDIRSDVSYQITRDIAVRAGLQIIDVATGVWRGGSQDPSRNNLFGGSSDQDLVMLGGSFGITVNR